MIAALIPEHLFTDLASAEWALWGLAAGGLAVLVVGADRMVTAAAKLATALGVSKVIIGATVVSLGTTSPEASVSVMAAWRGNPGLALGNGIGSIICNMALIFGLSCALKRLPLDRYVLNRQGLFQFGSALLLGATVLGLWAAAGGTLTGVMIHRWIGFTYLALLAGYLALSVRWGREHPELVPAEAALHMKKNHVVRRALGNFAIVAAGLAAVVFSSEVLVGSATQIARNHRIPETVIAATFVAFGTSLPELVTAVASLMKGHSEISLGNVVGANVLNVLFVIGAAAAAMPLKVDAATFHFMIPAMLVVLGLFQLYVLFNRDSFRRWQGVLLLGLYAAFILVSVLRYGVGL